MTSGWEITDLLSNAGLYNQAHAKYRETPSINISSGRSRPSEGFNWYSNENGRLAMSNQKTVSRFIQPL